MSNEIIYVCNSINNKNVREGELVILEKHEEQLYFEFGENYTNTKKRFYNDIETLNKDFNALLKLKSNQISEEVKIQEDKQNSIEEDVKEENRKEKSKEIKPRKRYSKKDLF